MVFVALLVILAALAAGCGGSEPESAPAAQPTEATTTTDLTTTTTPATTEEKKPEKRAKALPGLPAFTAGYRGGIKLNSSPIPPRESGDAHLGTKNVFVSKPIGPNGRFPNGTIVVKEASRPGTDFIGLIATMRKVKGADPAHNDWIFVEWARDDPNERFTELARDGVCWGCHAGALDSDYVFTAAP
jgi:hypothetical protein